MDELMMKLLSRKLHLQSRLQMNADFNTIDRHVRA